jgi:hypothetical protein
MQQKAIERLDRLNRQNKSYAAIIPYTINPRSALDKVTGKRTSEMHTRRE